VCTKSLIFRIIYHSGETLQRDFAAEHYIVSQNHLVQGASVDGKRLKPQGRMVRSDRYKYCLYSEGDRRESLVDMENDPGEMVNQAGNPDFKEALNQQRAFLKEFAERHKDLTALEMLDHLETDQR
jgi:arylsulfatase A-like enzyme